MLLSEFCRPTVHCVEFTGVNYRRQLFAIRFGQSINEIDMVRLMVDVKQYLHLTRGDI